MTRQPLITAVALWLAVLLFAGCDGPAEQAGEKVDERIQQQKEQIKDTEGEIAEAKQEIKKLQEELVQAEKESRQAQEQLNIAREERRQALAEMQKVIGNGVRTEQTSDQGGLQNVQSQESNRQAAQQSANDQQMQQNNQNSQAQPQ